MKRTLFTLFVLLITSQITLASGIGYVDYNVIYKNSPVANTYKKKISAKVQQVKAYNNTTKQQMAQQTTTEGKNKVYNQRKAGYEKLAKEYLTLRKEYITTISNKISTASSTIMTQKGLDAVVDKRAMVSGGVDITADVLKAVK